MIEGKAYLKEEKIYISSVMKPFDPVFIAEMKTIQGRKYEGGTENSFPTSSKDSVISFCAKWGLDYKGIEDINTTTVLPNPKKIYVEKGRIFVEFPYTDEDKDIVKGMKVLTFDDVRKAWTTKNLDVLPMLVRGLSKYGFSFDGDDSFLAAKEKNKNSFNDEETEFRADIPNVREGMELLPYQWVPVEKALKTRNLINCDSQGLGKTFTSLATLSIEGSEKIVIVAPASLTENWKNEANAFFKEGAFRIYQAEGRTPSPIPEGYNVVLLSWDVFVKWEPTLTKWKPDAIIVDEAHYGKSGKKSQRGETYINFGKNNKSALKILLTGTILLNRPIEVLAALQFMGIEKQFGGVTAFRNRYCGPEYITTPYGTTVTYKGAENLDELHEILTSSGVYLRRTKELLQRKGILKKKYVNGVEFFDDKERKPIVISPTDDEKKKVEDISINFKKRLDEKRKSIAKELRLPEYHAKVKEKMKSGRSGEVLALLSEYRKEIGLVKVRGVLDYVDSLVGRGEKVIIFAHHREVVDAYASYYSGIKIQGGMGAKKIEEAKRLFNEGSQEEHPVLVVSGEAGKTGHNLIGRKKGSNDKTCAYTIFAEEFYVYGDVEQMEDRSYRVGQDRDVTIYDILFPTDVDRMIFAAREEKRKIFNAVIDGLNIEDNDEESINYQIIDTFLT